MQISPKNLALTSEEAKALLDSYSYAAGVASPPLQDVGTLNLRLDQHQKWLETNGAKGVRLFAENENFTGMDFSHRNLTCAEFIGCTFVACTFYDATLGESQLEPRNTRLHQCTITKSIFTNAVLTGTSIIDCKIDDCNFLAANLQRVSATGTLATADNADEDEHESISVGNNFDMCHIVDSTFSLFEWSNSTFENCNLERTWFYDCVFGPVDFSRAKPSSSLLFKGCKLFSADFSDLLITGSKFLSCKLRMAKFHRTLAALSDFTGSDVAGADFSDADVSHSQWNKVIALQATFARSKMNNSEARIANFNDADFRECQLYSSDLSGSNLEYARIDATTNKNLVNFSGCTWINGRQCKAESIGVCYEE